MIGESKLLRVIGLAVVAVKYAGKGETVYNSTMQMCAEAQKFTNYIITGNLPR